MHTLRNLILLLVLGALLLYTKDVEAICGYQICPASKIDYINVHLVPHSHNDLGWLKTIDQYFEGSRNFIQRASVQNILDTVVQELLKDQSRRFIYAEMAYFFKWYFEQSEQMRRDVLKLVNEGRLEFVGGGWSANDEATVHYQSVIDQYSLGLQKISEYFGSCGRPRIAWQIDSFGHSSEMASIFAQMGYDGEFFARLDWVEKSKRMGNLDGEMIWKSSDSLGDRSDIFTSILYNHYSAPPGFCFDALCVDEPIIDAESYDNNVKERIDEFTAYIMHMSEKYNTKDLLVPMGDDFNYENALINFRNMDNLIKYTNLRQANGSRIHAFYSTPSCYLNSLHKQLTSWPVKRSDFFPYSTDQNSYWTGFYSSRPTLKRFERHANHFLQVVKQLTALAKVTEKDLLRNVDVLRQMVGIMQHHDAITGTQKQHVADDYSRLLTDAVRAGQRAAHGALQILTNLTNGEFFSCQLLNISVCEPTHFHTNNVVLTLVNPSAHKMTQYVRLPVKNGSYVVLDSEYREVPTQIIPLSKQVYVLPFRSQDTDMELVFQATVDKLANYYLKAIKHHQDYMVDLSRSADAVPMRFSRYRYRKTREASALQMNETSELKQAVPKTIQETSTDSVAVRVIPHRYRKPREVLEIPEHDTLKWERVRRKTNHKPQTALLWTTEPTRLNPHLAHVMKQSPRVTSTSSHKPTQHLTQTTTAYIHSTSKVETTQRMPETTQRMPETTQRMPETTEYIGTKSTEYINTETTTAEALRATQRSKHEITLENSLIKLFFGKSGHLMRMEMNGIAETVRQDFFYYKSAEGSNWPPTNRSSGAYVFRPDSTEIPVSSKVFSTVYEGQLVKEVHQRFNEWISQVVRIYEGVNRVEFEWMVGPIPIKDKIGKEVITRFSTNINTNGVFWTDSNGREMLQRIQNKRDHFTPDLTEKISGNYYPVTTRIALQNEHKRFTVFTDRAQGGSSLQNGCLDLMVHRRLLHDDGFGVGEALNEMAYDDGLIVRGKMYVMLSSAHQKPSYYERLAQREIFLPFWYFFSNSSRQVAIAPLVDFTYLPEEIELLTLESFGDNQFLVRLENIMDKSESVPVTFNIRKIFDHLGGEEIHETTLDGNMMLTDMKRFKFAPRGIRSKKPEIYQAKHMPLMLKSSDPTVSFTITLDPMQIRTFLIRWK